MEINREIAAKVLKVVDAGLCQGVGEPVPGQMCVEAAVCFALGLPHSDDPPCVGRTVRAFKIRLNDSAWSSSDARAKGMREVAIAQLGSDQVDQVAFAREVVEQTIRQIVPIALRAAARVVVAHAEQLEAAAVRCEKEGTKDAARAAYAAARAAYAAARAAADAAYAADDAAYAVADAAARAARAAYAAARAAAAYAAADDAAYAAYAAADAAARAARAADAAADADADTAAYAAYAADAYAADAARDSVLSRAAKIAVEALTKLGAAGVQYLYLCKEAA